MFIPLTQKERNDHFTQNYKSFIPGYTGHCPTLRFHYGTCYGAKTKEILTELRDKRVIQDVQSQPYRQNDPGKAILRPIERIGGQMRDFGLDNKYRCPKYIIGYTGFIPTLNFRYGKSYGRSADDSMYEFTENLRRLKEARQNKERIAATDTPKTRPLRQEDEVTLLLNEYEEKRRYKAKEISPDCPPIAGYTGHIPRVKGNEESLSQRYNTVVKRGFNILKQERQKRDAMKNIQLKITDIVNEQEQPYIPKNS
ncbi:Protein of unknown function (DUF2475) [Popillia japonica]|uniref:Ciliary microtubule inner protein 2A-C-like domain-containing protein n=1 Tax=Popillia japonica TaxID=7064 RepID=A0AAW1N292_POPJA